MHLSLGNVYINFILVQFYIGPANSIIYSNLKNEDSTSLNQNNILKVSLTQKGYIQFLKYDIEAPEIHDYTFCLWIRSNNFTYSHPLLSYSKDEKQRLIRVWIAPYGSSINFELFEIPVFTVPMNFVENRFYHICQSWDSRMGAWALYIDGSLKKMGEIPQLKNFAIPSKGDIVVGQEYTDFDKGLDDGIEGDISGFNLVLSSTFRNNKNYVVTKRPLNQQLLLDFSVNGKKSNMDLLDFNNADEYIEAFKPKVINWFTRKRRNIKELYKKPLGQILVELSKDCAYLKGAPLSGKGVLVNWTKTPVRVFGGAILKTVSSFCARRSDQ